MSTDYHWITWFIIATIATALPYILVKKYPEMNNSFLLLVTLVSHIILTTAYWVILANKNITRIYPLLNIFLSLLLYFQACFYLQEKQ